MVEENGIIVQTVYMEQKVDMREKNTLVNLIKKMNMKKTIGANITKVKKSKNNINTVI